ncbi:MAG: ABC transporter ATP-binding protein [Verrucomicrobia bacterium]|nr:ABC transporter ATP-binding protein [Verrucomicrobiota bacterium]
MKPSPLLNVQNLRVEFSSGAKTIVAVENVTFSIAPGETVAVVGESGSGKTTAALALTRLTPPPPACRLSGQVVWQDGTDLLTCSDTDLRRARGGKLAYIFQEPSTSLNPVFSIGFQISEALRLHQPAIADVDAEVARLLGLVGIRDPELRSRDYPHQLSGGMQQRAMIAMALACQPKLLVADEPTTALDVTIQAQILDLLRDLRQKFGMSVLLITHNFGIVANFADRVLVMLDGKLVEQGPVKEILRSPQHPYTKALLDCIPRLGQKTRRLASIDRALLAAK